MRVFEQSGKYVDHEVDVRWHFDYAGRAAKFGAWTDPGNCDSTTAWKQTKNGLVRAAIVARDRMTRKIYTIAECDGHEFVEFRWISCASLPMTPRSLAGQTVKFVGSINGMTLVTPKEKVHVYVNGQVVREANAEPAIVSHAWKN